MRIGYSLLASSAAALLLWGSGLATQTPDGRDAQSPTTAQSIDSSTQTAASSEKHKREKQKRWSGSLVDTNCMATAMSGAAGAIDQGSSQPDAGSTQTRLPEPVPENPAPQPGRSPSARMDPSQSRQAGVLPPGQNPDQNPDISQAQAAQMARASRVDNQAKQCAATVATTAFGLALPGGQVVRLDGEGNAKASEALKAITVEPGKPVKAKVTGTLESGDTVKVALVEIKGKRSAPASATQGR